VENPKFNIQKPTSLKLSFCPVKRMGALICMVQKSAEMKKIT